MRLFIIAAIVCFVIALLGAIGAFSGVDVRAWAIGGLLAISLDMATGYVLNVRGGA
ncbi:MAG: hypothetical protein KGL39_46490 [Patescibacteria group bacterium]|nr:hypothetical protein [Patescibacteria group bacterium]